jgi:hypothetical protein
VRLVLGFDVRYRLGYEDGERVGGGGHGNFEDVDRRGNFEGPGDVDCHGFGGELRGRRKRMFGSNGSCEPGGLCRWRLVAELGAVVAAAFVPGLAAGVEVALRAACFGIGMGMRAGFGQAAA